MNRIFALTLVILFLSGNLIAQEENCANTLQTAQEEFIAGRFYGIPSMLKACIDRGFTDEQKRDAYLLLTRAYLYIDDPIGAENAYLGLLSIDPEYIAFPPRDQIELVFLSQRFTTRPIFTLHYKLGTNASIERVISPVSISGLPNTDIDSKVGFGIHLSGGIDFNLTDLISFGTELNIAQRNFRRNTFLVSDPLNVSISQLLIEMPVYIKFQKNHGAIRPYGYTGFAMNMLLLDGWNLELIHRLGNSESDPEIIEPSSRINVLPVRNKFNRSLVFGGGVLYKVGSNFFKAELSYTAGLNNYVNSELQLDYAVKNPNSSYNNFFSYGYVDNYFSVNNLALSLGYVKPLYKPRLRKNPGTKKLSRQLIKSESAEDTDL